MVMDNDINCLNFKGLLAYLKKSIGPQAVDRVTEGLINNPEYRVRDKRDPGRITPLTLAHLTDSAYWVSNECSLKLLGNVNLVVEADNPLFTAGIGAVEAGLSGSALFAGKVMGPSALVRQAARINGRFNRTKDVVVTRNEPESVMIELHYRDGFRVTQDVCNWNLGIYTGLARLSGVRQVTSEETRCVLRGDSCCEFHLRWKKAGALKRVLRSALTWLVRSDIRQMIDEHAATLNERDQLIRQLVRSEEKYRTLFEDSMEAMNLTQNGRIRDVNPAWLALHGYASKAEVLGMDVLDVIHPDDHGILTTRRRQWPDVAERMFQTRDLCKDGTVIAVEVYSTRIVIAGEAMILATIRDVSAIRKAEKEREQLELRLQRSEKMQAIGTLAGGVAHDLNNILSGIVSYPELILMQLPEGDDLRGPIQTIHETGKKAAAIVQDLLTMARRGVSVSETVDLNRLIESYLASPEHGKMLDYHSLVTVQLQLEADPGYLVGSSVHLNKTVMNLISNSAEAMPDGGTIRLATANCKLAQPIFGYEEVPPGRYVTMTVADTGTGIDPNDLHRIFEPFYTKKKMGRSGTGLGMSVVWGTVRDHKGYIDARSIPGQGTTFTLYFPMPDRAVDLHADDEAERAWKGNGESILVVDDNREQREIAARILSELGYRVETAPSGESAVETLSTKSVELVILDMIMDPGMDGLETYRKIRELRPDQKTLIVSGFSETDRVREAQRLGAGRYVRKPYDIHTIADAVRDSLSSR